MHRGYIRRWKMLKFICVSLSSLPMGSMSSLEIESAHRMRMIYKLNRK